MNYKRMLPIEVVMIFAFFTVVCLVWMVNTPWQRQHNNMWYRGFSKRGGDAPSEDEASPHVVVFLDGSYLFERDKLIVEPVQATHAMLASLRARGTAWPLVFLFVTQGQWQIIEEQQGTAARAIMAIVDENNVQLVQKAEDHLWAHKVLQVLDGDTDTSITLPPRGIYLLISTPYVLVQHDPDNWWKATSPPVKGNGTPRDGDYVLLVTSLPTPNPMDENLVFDSHCVFCNNDNSSNSADDLINSTFLQDKHRGMASVLMSNPSFSGDVMVATSLAAAREFVGHISNYGRYMLLCPEHSLVNGVKVTCYANITQSHEATQGPTVITQNIQSIDSMVLFVGQEEDLIVEDGSLLKNGSNNSPWMVVGYNQNDDLLHYFSSMYPLRGLKPSPGTAKHGYYQTKDNREIKGDKNNWKSEKRNQSHVRGLAAALSAVKKHSDRVYELEHWATLSRAEVERLVKPVCRKSLEFPDFTTMTSVLNPENVSSVHLVGVEDLHRYHAISDYPKYVLPDGDDQQACALWPDSSFCNNATMSKHTCRWKRFIQATDCAFIDDGSVHPDVPGLVYDSKHWYPDHAQKDSAPWGNSSKVIHEYDELGNGLSTYGAAPAHFWIEVLPQILHMNAVLPPHVKLLVDDSNNQVKRIIENMYKMKILPANRIESWKGRGHVYAAKRVYHSAEMALPPTETMNHGAVESLSSEFKYIAVEFCFWKNALPLHLVRWSIQPYFQPAGQRRDIVVLHRRDAESRKVKNQNEVVASLSAAFPDRDVVELVISEHSVDNVAHVMFKAGLFIAPHGAGLVNMMFLAPGTPVIEFAYTAPGRMAWPADYFYPSAVNLELKYGVVLADGDYDSEMTVPPEKVVSLSKTLLADP